MKASVGEYKANVVHRWRCLVREGLPSVDVIFGPIVILALAASYDPRLSGVGVDHESVFSSNARGKNLEMGPQGRGALRDSDYLHFFPNVFPQFVYRKLCYMAGKPVKSKRPFGRKFGLDYLKPSVWRRRRSLVNV